MTELSARAKALKPSPIRRFFDLLETMEDAISLGVGEPDFQTPWPVRDAAIASLEKGHTKYSPNAGLSALRREVSRYLERRFELSYAFDSEVLITVGGSEAMDLAVRALCDPGDEALIPQPSFVCYAPIALLAGATPTAIVTRAEDDFRLTPEALRAAITPRTKVLFLPFPNNPTGGVMTREDLAAIADVLRDTSIMIISDELYAELTYGQRHISLASLPGMSKRCVVVGGLSKSHAMTGWRLGFACAPRHILSAMTTIHQYAVMCAPTTSQYAACEALSGGDSAVEHMREEYDRRRRFVLDAFRQMGLPCFEPRGAFYAFPNLQGTGLSSSEFCERLLTQERVAVIPGNAFGEGGEGFFRACYAASLPTLAEAMKRLDRFLSSL